MKLTDTIPSKLEVGEYKRVKRLMEQAEFYAKRHQEAVEVWLEGAIKQVWLDEGGCLCIEYQSGRWWHYNAYGEWW